MPIASMTGFVRDQGEKDGTLWTWEIRSVNARGLDIRLRLPVGMESLDPAVRARISGVFARGSVTVSLSIAAVQGQIKLRLNEEALADLAHIIERMKEVLPAAAARLDGLLAVHGLLEEADSASDPALVLARYEDDILTSLDRALGALVQTRLDEGERIARALDTMLDELAAIAERIGARAHVQPQLVLERLRQRLQELAATPLEIAEDRIAQEAVLLASKADVREELDRLNAHLSSAGQLLQASEPVGRRLDFLCQEMNREANTICSKSVDLALAQAGLDLEARIEQFRE